MKKILLLLFLTTGIVLILLFSFKDDEIPSFVNKNLVEVEEYCNKYKINLEVEKTYDVNVEENKVINQEFLDDNTLKITLSLGKNKSELYEKFQVNELGNVPIMMYHGIQNITDNKYTGGNIDIAGYQRTAKAFKEDLEFYYQNNYRMIRLIDYVNGIIDVKLGYSPIILTFDDGLSNNIKVLGRDDSNKLIIDPNSAVGILEEFKNKYPDYNITATFFINSNLFNQSEYNEEILLWLIEHNYDIGNHTTTHTSLAGTTKEQTIKEIGKQYEKLEHIIGNKYVPIVALPFGEPYSKTHQNFQYILEGTYNNKSYKTESLLRVGWEGELSPFHKNFDKTYLKRIRAYDNNGADFDIKYNFNILDKTKYISDGNKDTIVVKDKDKDLISPNNNLEIITY